VSRAPPLLPNTAVSGCNRRMWPSTQPAGSCLVSEAGAACLFLHLLSISRAVAHGMQLNKGAHWGDLESEEEAESEEEEEEEEAQEPDEAVSPTE
jgi:hypothetical protein